MLCNLVIVSPISLHFCVLILQTASFKWSMLEVMTEVLSIQERFIFPIMLERFLGIIDRFFNLSEIPCDPNVPNMNHTP